MKNFLQRTALFTLLLSSLNIAASCDDRYRKETYSKSQLGVDAIYMLVSGSGDYGKIFRNKYPGGNVYYEYYINSLNSIDIGYSWTTRNSKVSAYNAPTVLFGSAQVGTPIHARIRFKNTYLNWTYHYPISHNCIKDLEMLFSAGLGFSRQKITVTQNPAVAGAVYTGFRGKTRAVPMLGLGMQGMVTDTMGLRGGLRYESLSRVRLRGANDGGKAFGKAMVLSVGLYWII